MSDRHMQNHHLLVGWVHMFSLNEKTAIAAFIIIWTISVGMSVWCMWGGGGYFM